MAPNPYDAVAEKVLMDLEMAVRKDKSINEFVIVLTTEAENRNRSPILKGECAIGIQSWIVPHIYPFAHHQIMQKSNYKAQNLEKVMTCLLGVALLNPDMSTVWNKRKELILSKKMSADTELQITRMALSRKPKSSEALAHRRWIITQILKEVQDKTVLLQEELNLCEIIADRYHSNYQAWSHRMWSLQHLLPDPPHWNIMKKGVKHLVVDIMQNDISRVMFSNISRSKYLSITNTETFHVYSSEIETNYKWVSTHVSDHSGFHFRKFLINQMYIYLMDNFYSSCNMESDYDDNGTSLAVQCKSAPSFFQTRRVVLIEFLKSLENDNCYRKVVQEYLINLEHSSTLFDLVVSLILSEFKSNHSLCQMFPGHEALWYYRRCLTHMFKTIVLDNMTNSGQTTFSHQDMNGVPHRKDLKYDYSVKPNEQKLGAKLSDMFHIFYTQFVKNEQDVIQSSLRASDENEKKSVKDYEHWLKIFFKANENLF